jgi:hypothetical protein
MMMRWLLIAGLVWGFWVRAAEWDAGAGSSAPGSVQTMDGGDPFPRFVDPAGGVKTMDGGDPFPR